MPDHLKLNVWIGMENQYVLSTWLTTEHMLIYCEHPSTQITSDYDSKHWSLLFLVFPVLTFWVIWKNIPIPNYPDIFQPVHPAVCTDPMWRLIQHSCTSSVCEESLVGSCTKKRSICQTEAVVYWSRPADGLWRHNGAFFGSLLPSWNVEPVGEWSLCVVLCITCHFHRRKKKTPLSNERKRFCKCNF